MSAIESPVDRANREGLQFWYGFLAANPDMDGLDLAALDRYLESVAAQHAAPEDMRPLATTSQGRSLASQAWELRHTLHWRQPQTDDIFLALRWRSVSQRADDRYNRRDHHHPFTHGRLPEFPGTTKPSRVAIAEELIAARGAREHLGLRPLPDAGELLIWWLHRIKDPITIRETFSRIARRVNAADEESQP